MAEDIATLGLEVKSHSITAADRELNKLRQTAGVTERSTNRLTSASDGLAGSFRNTASTVAVMHGPLGGVASRFSAMATLMSRVGLAAGSMAVGLGAATFAAQRGVRAFAEYERQQLTTQAIIRATGGIAGRTAEDIENLSRGIGMATLASTSEVRQAAQQLLTFRSIAGDTFNETLVLAQDLAASGFGTITSSAMQLAKALEDPTTGLVALRRSGISFSASQRDLINSLYETGQAAKGADMILAQVRAQVGGAGEAAGGGLSGAFDSLTEQTGRWFELIGGRIADVTNLEDKMRGLAEGVQAVNDAMELSGTPGGRVSQLQREHDALTAFMAEERKHIEFLRSAGVPERQIQSIIPGLEEATTRLPLIRNEMRELNMLTERAAELEKQRVEAQAAAARDEAARQRIEDVEDEIQKRIELIGVSEQELAVRKALAQAQTSDPAAVQRIEELIAAEYAKIEANKQSIQAEEEKASAIERGREAVAGIIADLETELAVLRESDPVKQRMIELSRDMAQATAEERAQIEQNVRAIERENASRAAAQMEGELRQRIALVGATKAQVAAQNAMQRAADLGATRAQIKRIGELAAAHVQAAEAAEAHRRRQEQLRREWEQARRASADLIRSLQTELDIMRETDPVQRELIRLRDQMAGATARERQEIEALVRAKHAEADANRAISNSQPDRGAGTTSGGSFEGTTTTHSVSMDFTPTSQLQRLSEMGAERNLIQTALQFKQLSPEEVEKAEHRLAELAISTAKLQQALVKYEGQVERGIAAYKQYTSNITNHRGRTSATTMQEMMGFVGAFPAFADGGTLPRGQFGIVGEAGPELIKGPADIIPLNGSVQGPQAVTHNNDNSRGDVNISVNIPAQNGGGDSRHSTRERARQIANEVAYELRQQGII